jgi:carboxyl-terminal processing protease
MPRRNLALLAFLAVVSLACYLKVDYYGRLLVFAMDEIEGRALEEVTSKELFQGALQGMTRRLDDDYSVYIPPKEFSEFEASLDQEFGGVGIQVLMDKQTKQLTVVAPLYGTPAYKAGIRAGDKILRIDGVSTHGLSLEDCTQRMRGKPGQPVVLTIQHPGEENPIDAKMVRAVIQVDSVLGDTRDAEGQWNYFLDGHDRIGYLRIETFGKETVNELRQALAEMTRSGMRALILDVRNDPGGLLGAAVAACDLFVRSGAIVTTRDRYGNVKRDFQATGQGTYGNIPIVVLVNHYSASASEIFAACLQDHKKAVVVGERTYGKGTVQELIELEDGLGALKLTTSSYWRPSGVNINRTKKATDEDIWGVRPDPGYEVVLSEEDRIRLLRWRNRRDAGQKREGNHAPDELDPADLRVDRQLLKALEYVEKAVGTRK